MQVELNSCGSAVMRARQWSSRAGAWSDPHPTLGLSFVSFFWMRLDLDVANMGKVMALMPTVDGGGDSEGDGEEDGEEDGEGSIRSLGAAIWRSSSEALRIEPCWRSVRTTRR
jgi:hypothetical protein